MSLNIPYMIDPPLNPEAYNDVEVQGSLLFANWAIKIVNDMPVSDEEIDSIIRRYENELDIFVAVLVGLYINMQDQAEDGLRLTTRLLAAIMYYGRSRRKPFVHQAD